MIIIINKMIIKINKSQENATERRKGRKRRERKSVEKKGKLVNIVE